MTNEYEITKVLPNNGQRVLCYGNATFCCAEDMGEPAWHEVTFKIQLGSYRIKKEVPKDPEESILEACSFFEIWECGEGHVIGVTKWKHIP